MEPLHVHDLLMIQNSRWPGTETNSLSFEPSSHFFTEYIPWLARPHILGP